jgi:hypothetical protein
MRVTGVPFLARRRGRAGVDGGNRRFVGRRIARAAAERYAGPPSGARHENGLEGGSDGGGRHVVPQADAAA